MQLRQLVLVWVLGVPFGLLGQGGEARLGAVEPPVADTPTAEEAPAPAADPEPTLTLPGIEERIAKAGADAEPSRLAKLEEIAAALRQEQKWELQRQTLEERLEDADQSLAEYEQELAGSEPLATDFPDVATAQRKLSEYEQRLEEVTEEAGEIETRVRDSSAQRVAQSDRLAEINQRLEEVAASEPEGELSAMQLIADKRALMAEKALLSLRQSDYDRFLALDQKQAAVLRQRAGRLEAAISALEADIAERKQSALDEAMRELEALGENIGPEEPALTRVFQRVKELVALRETVSEHREEAAEVRAANTRRAASLETARRDFEELLALAGPTKEIAQALLAEMDQAPHVPDLHERRADMNERLKEIRLQILRLEQEARDWESHEAAFQRLEASLGDASTPALTEEKRQLLQRLLALRQQHFSALQNETAGYLKLLAQANTALAELEAQALALRDFGEINLVRMPNMDVIRFESLGRSFAAFGGTALTLLAVLMPAISLLGLLQVLAAAALLGIGYLAARRTRFLLQKPLAEASFGHSLLILGADFLWAAAVPLALLVLCFSETFSIGTLGVQVALSNYGLFLFAGILLFRVARPQGLGAKHFRWTEASCQRLRTAILFLGFPLIFLLFVGALHWVLAQSPGERETIGWPNILMRILAISLAVYALHPSRGVFAQASRKALVHRPLFRWGVFLLIVAAEVFFLVLSTLGYAYSTWLFSVKVQQTLALIVGLVLVHGLFIRYLRLHRYKVIRVQEEQRQIKLAEAEHAQKDDTGMAPRVEDIYEIDPRELDDHGRRVLLTLILVLTYVGLSSIWGPLLGAMSEVANWTLFSYGVEETLSVRELLQLAVIGVFTWVLATNLPLIVDSLAVSRLTKESGNRYAVRSVMAYVIVLFGVFLATQTLNIAWGDVQWLIAGISVGLGFGLQEIFANFVSGIIILFERPVRVGDIVTIGDTSGTVTRIRIRSTTVENWDRQELIVPNKEFISNKLINWTRSNTINRLKIPVRVNYGSDINKVQAILEDVLNKHPDVAKEPAPFVYFLEFGEYALHFTCFAYLDSLDRRLAVNHELCTEINRCLADAGVVIPLPQRDVNLYDKSKAEESAPARSKE